MHREVPCQEVKVREVAKVVPYTWVHGGRLFDGGSLSSMMAMAYGSEETGVLVTRKNAPPRSSARALTAHPPPIQTTLCALVASQLEEVREAPDSLGTVWPVTPG